VNGVAVDAEKLRELAQRSAVRARDEDEELAKRK